MPNEFINNRVCANYYHDIYENIIFQVSCEYIKPQGWCHTISTDDYGLSFQSFEFKVIRFESALMREARTEADLSFILYFCFIFLSSLPLFPKEGEVMSYHLLILLNLFSFVFPVVFLVCLTGCSAYLQSSALLISCAYFVLWQFVVTWGPAASTYTFICPFGSHVTHLLLILFMYVMV